MIKVISTLLDDTKKVITRWIETDAWDCRGSLGMSAGIFKEERPYPDSHHIEDEIKETNKGDITVKEFKDSVDKYFKNTTPEQLDKDLKKAGIDVYSSTPSIWFKNSMLECEKDPRFHTESALMDVTERICEMYGQPKGIYGFLFWLLQWSADKLIWRKKGGLNNGK